MLTSVPALDFRSRDSAAVDVAYIRCRFPCWLPISLKHPKLSQITWVLRSLLEHAVSSKLPLQLICSQWANRKLNKNCSYRRLPRVTDCIGLDWILITFWICYYALAFIRTALKYIYVSSKYFIKYYVTSIYYSANKLLLRSSFRQDSTLDQLVPAHSIISDIQSAAATLLVASIARLGVSVSHSWLFFRLASRLLVSLRLDIDKTNSFISRWSQHKVRGWREAGHFACFP